MKEAKRWLEKAEKDLLAAEINLRQDLYEVSAFLSHQAAEKALKALYVLKFRRLWKIHDLEKLCLALKAKEIVKMCRKLNPHYIETRYPVESKYTKEVAKTALKNAKKVVMWVKRRLKRLKKA